MRIWRYGDNVDTDMLFPGKHLYTSNTMEEIKQHLLEDLDPDFDKQVQPGDLIIGGKNFGCGSSREQPIIGLKAVGIGAIIAESFARIFYRSAINQGLMLIECPDAVKAYRDGDRISLDIDNGCIMVGDKTFSFPRLPPELLAIREAGGILSYTRKQLKQKK
jgi:3-isopropylmalate/(R)-2-methylmalate dehydratase small subunit